MIELRQVSKKYSSGKGVTDISLEMPSQGIVGVFGENGSGKTTLFRILLGLLRMDFGEVLIDHIPLDSFPHLKMGYCPEERCLTMAHRVNDAIVLVGKCKGMKSDEIDEKINDWFSYFDIRQLRYKRMKELSKGNQQLIQLLSAWMHEPEILVLDEPLNGLDEDRVRKLVTFLKDYAKNHLVIISFHQMELIPYICDMCVYLKDGRVVDVTHQVAEIFGA